MDGAIRKALLLAAVAMPAAPGCKGTVGTTATSMLKHARESNDPNIRYLAYAKLAQDRAYDSEEQKSEASRVLSEALISGKEPVATRVVLCRTLGFLGRPESREAILRSVNDEEALIRAAASRALGRVGKPEDWTVLARVMSADSDLDCRIAAIEGLSAMKVADPRLDLLLVDGMEDPEPAIRLACLNALKALSGEDLGVEPSAWKKYAQDRSKLASGEKGDAPKR